jgi:hypothetical protein
MLRIFSFIIMVVFITISTVSEAKERKRLPTDLNTLEKLNKKLDQNYSAMDLTLKDDLTAARLTKKTIEEMGYDYDKTYLYFLFKGEPLESNYLGNIARKMVLSPGSNLEKAVSEKIISKNSYDAFMLSQTAVNINFKLAKLIYGCADKYKTDNLDEEMVSDCFLNSDFKNDVIDNEGNLNGLKLFQTVGSGKNLRTYNGTIQIIKRLDLKDLEAKKKKLDDIIKSLK